jgi:hypothetical protein
LFSSDDPYYFRFLLSFSDGILHAYPLPPSGATRKLVINATITNIQTEQSIQVQLHVDGGCEAFELVLLSEDVDRLNITPTGDTENGVQQDGSVLSLAEYERVRVELLHSDGTEETAKLVPVVNMQNHVSPEQSSAAHVVPASDAPIQRLLGYGGLTRFGLKQDFVGHKLVHFLKRA